MRYGSNIKPNMYINQVFISNKNTGKLNLNILYLHIRAEGREKIINICRCMKCLRIYLFSITQNNMNGNF